MPSSELDSLALARLVVLYSRSKQFAYVSCFRRVFCCFIAFQLPECLLELILCMIPVLYLKSFTSSSRTIPYSFLK